jgi:excinuclease ABC subunit B
LFDPLTGRIRQKVPRFVIYPKAITSRRATRDDSGRNHQLELSEPGGAVCQPGKLVELSGFGFDLEMLLEIVMQGIEELHAPPWRRRPPPSRCATRQDSVMFLDESHVMIGQLNAMYNGDRAQKATWWTTAFACQSALDNRPLKFEEFETKDAADVFCLHHRCLWPGRWSADGATHWPGGPW